MREVQTTPVIIKTNITVRKIAKENPEKIISSINPHNDPTPKACMLILKYMLAINAAEEAIKTPNINPVRITGTSGWFLKTKNIQK